MAAAAGLVLAAPTAVPATAEPAPNRAEWWFDSYAIQTKVWPLTKGAGVTVAVIDTGVSAGLPVFSGGTILPGTDVEGNGGDGRQDTDSGAGHGTVMASLIAGQGGGPGGWLGIAPEAKILSIVANISVERSSRAIRYAADHGATASRRAQWWSAHPTTARHRSKTRSPTR